MNFATFDLNLMRVLDAILREGSTVHAAKRLNMSQSAVSGALARLRYSLCDELFVRHGNRLVPTDYAKSIELPLREELDRLAAILAPPSAFDPATAVGTFRITASDFFAEMLMPPLADLLRKQAPGIRAQLVDLVPNSYIDSLETYRADLALIPNQSIPNWTSSQPLFYSSFVVIARRRHLQLATAGLAPGTIVPMDLYCELDHALFSPEGNFSAMGDAALARMGRSRKVVMTLPVFSGVCRAVAESDLIALVPRQLAERVAPQMGLELYRPPMPIDPPLVIAVWHRRSASSPLHRWMREKIIGLTRRLNEGEHTSIGS
ncbi:LysR family transcriptional regulator [Sinorhizobium alkalisoli]|uniref:LysR family transcriptional regulator n=1 Tax=Sinorhizobium alkalisoli TaxID=1752398 RepID=A0A1E3VD18_9HYPH|nr:LysR family transcriptional regulator [Sinorhizobium alkalisoli]MCA1492361.1 LysR family transcriptional regulator [Ensifer sp. NBAIM29]MCG5480556.1 LysR family transcriptional regulator [Sinorhizobium alkalisoli]ODR91424.1 LysR family transcriptional regulator [Sinorhizobium alkalisoli]QFI66470.1 Transcriptional regulator, LysR family [Sinorhizobium alkalisoli]